jgi:hypothetical protein
MAFTNLCCEQQNTAAMAIAGPVLPITFVDIAGPRPTIEYLINNKKATSMIHSNANLYLRLNYENSKYFDIEELTEVGVYGISEPGKPNTSYKAQVKELKFKDLVLNNKEVSIFETYPPDNEGFGMLGRQWIRENRIIIDYDKNQVTIQPSKDQSEFIAKQLFKNNYTSVPMELNEIDNSYYVEVIINDKKLNFFVSTVTRLIIDSEYAKAANIGIGEMAGTFSGPSGRTGYVYYSKGPFALKIGEFEAATNGVIEDTYAYSNRQRPSDPTEQTGGTLGAAFLMEHKAIVDFGNLVLYLKKGE